MNGVSNFFTPPKLKVYVLALTRERDAASGDVSYTGVGFRPKLILFNMNVNAEPVASFGSDDGTRRSSTIQRGSTNWYTDGNAIVAMNLGVDAQSAVVSSFDVDGFTLTWTKSNAPAAGTMNIIATCLG